MNNGKLGAWGLRKPQAPGAGATMPRTPTARPKGEHLATLARVLRQIEVDTKMSKERAKRIKKYLTAAMAELQAEMLK